jgi:hypothetical protein
VEVSPFWEGMARLLLVERNRFVHTHKSVYEKMRVNGNRGRSLTNGPRISPKIF